MTRFDSGVKDFDAEEATSIRGIDGLRAIRLTRKSDMASLLLHEFEPNGRPVFRGAPLDVPLPDFDRPFVTQVYGPIALDGRQYLLEPIPACVPLTEVWESTLHEHAKQTASVLRALMRQIRVAAQSARNGGRPHGAVCVSNVILTTSGVYGLLQACIETNEGLVWVRPIPEYSLLDAVRDLDDEIAIANMAYRLMELAGASPNIGTGDKSELLEIARSTSLRHVAAEF